MRNRTNKVMLLVIFRIAVTFLFLSLLFPPILYAQKYNKKSQIFVDASSNNFPPMNLLDENGTLTGYGCELADAVMKAIGAEVTHIHSSHWNDVLQWLDSGKADFIHDTGYTKDREKFLDYSKPIIEMPEMIFVRPDQYDITGFNSLKGKKVACVNKHISHLYLQTFPEITCYVVKTPVEGLYELIAGKVDAFIYPKQIILYLAQNLRLTDKIKTTGDPLRILTWSMVVKKGNKELLTLLNEGIDKVKETGEYDRIYNKWWGKKVLSGYTKKELRIITSIAVGISIVLVSLIALLFYNHKLRVGKNRLEKEIFDRKKVEKVLLYSEERFRQLTENIHEVFWIGSPDWNKVYYISPAYEEIWGLSCEDLYNQPRSWLDTIVEEDRDRVIAHIPKKLENSSEIVFPEYRIVQPDGKIRWIFARAYPIRNELGEIYRVAGIAEDITERRQAETALKKSEKQFQDLFNSINDLIYTQDLKGRFISVNPAMHRLFGYEMDEFIGLTAADFMEPELQPGFNNRYLKAVKEQRGLAGIACYFKKNREKIYIEYNSSLVKPEGGEPYISGIGRDVTEKVLTEKKVKNLQEKVAQSQKMESIGTLAGGIAHDFNNILYPIMGFAEMAIEDLPKNHPIRENLKDILQGAKRARDLVKQILLFSRQKESEEKPLMLQPLIKEAIKLLRSTIPSNIEIIQDLYEDSDYVFGNTTEVHEIIMNLCTNAYHAMEKTGGTLKIDLNKVEGPDINLPARKSCCLSISDTGEGIPPEIINNIFDPYFTTKELGKGTGLGLSVIYGIVKKYKGDITVKSEPGKGTVFKVFLPITSKIIKSGKELNDQQLLVGDENILFVDDEEAIVKLGIRLLERFGYKVTGRVSSYEALDLFKSAPDRFDLVITDMAMPGMVGTDLTKKLMAIRPDIPIIICTGFSEMIDHETVNSLGIAAYINKPILLNELTSKVREVLDQSKKSI